VCTDIEKETREYIKGETRDEEKTVYYTGKV
jgi:hypothetical protein